jgi:hypothetical protein
MTRYNVTAWCNVAHYATFNVEAPSLSAALDKAREQAQDEHALACHGDAADWNAFQIYPSADESQTRTYFEPSRRIEMAAPALLDALLNIKRLAEKSGDHEADPFALLDLIAGEVHTALAQATGGAI